MLKSFTVTILLFFLPFCLKAQGMSIVVHAPLNVSMTNITDGVLDYGSLLPNEGLVEIPLIDSRTEIIRIQARSFNNVNVTITAPQNLQLNPSNTLPFTLGAAYANQCSENTSQAIPFPGGNTASFEMVDGGFWQKIFGCGNRPYYAEAYIYIYGDINVGNVNAGTYSGIINVYVEYD